MSIWVSWFISDIMNSIVLSASMLKKTKSDVQTYDKRFFIKYILSIILFALLCNLLLYNTSKILKTIFKILLLSAFLGNVFMEKNSKILMRVFLVYIIFAIFDTLFGLVYLGIFHMTMETFNNNAFYIIGGNILIAILTYIPLRLEKVERFIQNICEWYSGKGIINLIVNITLCIISLWFFINKNATGYTPLYEYILNFGIIIIIMIFVIGFFKENSDKNQIKKEYDQLLNYAKTYEQEVVEKSKWQHEYENQLIMIKDKIDPENKKALRYINKLLKNKPLNENSQWLGKLTKFPDIGIKGLLHYKICQMIQNNIQVYVDVIDEDLIPSKIPEKLLEENLQDISMALGVYLDNAMQAASESQSKYLIVEFKCTEEEIVFQISNTYKGNVSIDKMNQERFSTKGENHGYGLSIVRDILAKNKHLSQGKEMNGIYYVQKLVFRF